ncbi:MAG: hypothetical protein L6Q99_06535 [Planctomycetes bacterium]|nr:hypothetical protein [Planctomycetota bacterium]
MSFVQQGWPGIDLQRLDEHVRRLSLVGRTRGRRLSAAQRDIGRVALVTRALADLLIAKGLITQAELLGQIERTDLADDVADGELAADAVMPGSKVSSKRPSLPSAIPPEALARAKEHVKQVKVARPPQASPGHSALLERARKRLQVAREKERKQAVEAAKRPEPSKRELVVRAKERLKAAQEKKRRRNLP